MESSDTVRQRGTGRSVGLLRRWVASQLRVAAMDLHFQFYEQHCGCFPCLASNVGHVHVATCLISGMTIPEEDADVGQGSKYCLVAIGRLQVSKKPFLFVCLFCYFQHRVFPV